MSAPSPRSANIVTNPTAIVWSTGDPFDGYLWLGISLPTGYTTPSMWNANRPQTLPIYTKIPIIGGQIDPGTQIFFTADMNPPNTKYYAYWFDRLNRLVAPSSGTAVGFQVTASPYTITVPTLTALAAASSGPVPQS